MQHDSGQEKKKKRKEKSECYVRKRTIFLANWNRLRRVTQMKPVYGISCGSPLSIPRNRSDDRGSRRGELWCIYGSSVRVAVIKRGHVFYLSCNHFVSPSPLIPLLYLTLSSALFLSLPLSLFLSFSLSRVHDFSFFVYLYSSPLLKHPEEFTCTRLHSVRSTFDNLYLRRRINSCKNKVSYLKFHSMYSRNSYSVGRKVCNQTVDVHAFVGNLKLQKRICSKYRTSYIIINICFDDSWLTLV